MKTTRHGNIEQHTNEALAIELEHLMQELIVHYEQLYSFALIRRSAMRSADPDELGACIQQENKVVQSIAEIEKRRIAIVSEFAARLGSTRKSQTTMSWIAEQLAEPVRSRLLNIAQHLRGLIERVRKENDVARQAAETLARHMEGLMRSVASRLNHARTYGRRGAIEPGPRVLSALDVSS